MPYPNPLQSVSASGTYAPSQQVMSAIRNASAQTGTRFDTLLSAAALESGFTPTAQASTSSASGLFQFTEQTWLGAVRQYGAAHGLASDAAAIVQRGGQLTVEDPALKQRILDLRTNPGVSASLAGEHLRAVAAQLGASLGHSPDATETYLGHFLGTAGATQMLTALQSAPARPAAAVLPEAARANPTMFYAKDGTPYSTTQFVQHVHDRVAKVYSQLGYEMPQGALDFSGHTEAGQSADPPDAGASGWGSGTPRKSATPAERMMLASLAEVFTQVDRSASQASAVRQPNAHQRRNHQLPAGIVSALETVSGDTPVGPNPLSGLTPSGPTQSAVIQNALTQSGPGNASTAITTPQSAIITPAA
jgi:hypothetical protein